jgi:hypothetical protein
MLSLPNSQDDNFDLTKTNHYDDYDMKHAVERFTFFVHRIISSFFFLSLLFVSQIYD